MSPKCLFGVKEGRKIGFLWQGMDQASMFYEKNSKIQRNGPPRVVDKIEHEIIRFQDGIMNKIREIRWSI